MVEVGPDPVKVICLGSTELHKAIAEMVSASYADVILVDTPGEADIAVGSKEECEIVLRNSTVPVPYKLTCTVFEDVSAISAPAWNKPYPPPKGRRGVRKFL